jgi:hypothetical protein
MGNTGLSMILARARPEPGGLRSDTFMAKFSAVPAYNRTSCTMIHMRMFITFGCAGNADFFANFK